MQSEKNLRRELKRLPALIKRAIQEDDLEAALEMRHEISTLFWVLSDFA